MSRFFMVSGAVAGAVAVALGAFGAHQLKTALTPGRLDVFETGVRYLLIHSVALVVTGMLVRSHAQKSLSAAGILFLLGMALFSGSLIVLATTGYTVLGIVAPFGGLSFIAAWLLLASSAWRASP